MAYDVINGNNPSNVTCPWSQVYDPVTTLCEMCLTRCIPTKPELPPSHCNSCDDYWKKQTTFAAKKPWTENIDTSAKLNIRLVVTAAAVGCVIMFIVVISAAVVLYLRRKPRDQQGRQPDEDQLMSSSSDGLQTNTPSAAAQTGNDCRLQQTLRGLFCCRRFSSLAQLVQGDHHVANELRDSEAGTVVCSDSSSDASDTLDGYPQHDTSQSREHGSYQETADDSVGHHSRHQQQINASDGLSSDDDAGEIQQQVVPAVVQDEQGARLPATVAQNDHFKGEFFSAQQESCSVGPSERVPIPATDHDYIGKHAIQQEMTCSGKSDFVTTSFEEQNIICLPKSSQETWIVQSSDDEMTLKKTLEEAGVQLRPKPVALNALKRPLSSGSTDSTSRHDTLEQFRPRRWSSKMSSPGETERKLVDEPGLCFSIETLADVTRLAQQPSSVELEKDQLCLSESVAEATNKSQCLIDSPAVTLLFQWLDTQDWAIEYYIDSSGTKVIIGIDKQSDVTPASAEELMKCSRQDQGLEPVFVLSDLSGAVYLELMNRGVTAESHRQRHHHHRHHRFHGRGRHDGPCLRSGSFIKIRHKTTQSEGLFTGVFRDSSSGKLYGAAPGHGFEEVGEEVVWQFGTMEDGTYGEMSVGRCLLKVQPNFNSLTFRNREITSDVGLIELEDAVLSKLCDVVCVPSNLCRQSPPSQRPEHEPLHTTNDGILFGLRLAAIPPGKEVLFQTARNGWQRDIVDRNQATMKLPKGIRLSNVMTVSIGSHEIEKSDSGGLVVGVPSNGDIQLDVYGSTIGKLTIESRTFLVANRLDDVMTAIRFNTDYIIDTFDGNSHGRLELCGQHTKDGTEESSLLVNESGIESMQPVCGSL